MITHTSCPLASREAISLSTKNVFVEGLRAGSHHAAKRINRIIAMLMKHQSQISTQEGSDCLRPAAGDAKDMEQSGEGPTSKRDADLGGAGSSAGGDVGFGS